MTNADVKCSECTPANCFCDRPIRRRYENAIRTARIIEFGLTALGAGTAMYLIINGLVRVL